MQLVVQLLCPVPCLAELSLQLLLLCACCCQLCLCVLQLLLQAVCCQHLSLQVLKVLLKGLRGTQAGTCVRGGRWMGGGGGFG